MYMNDLSKNQTISLFSPFISVHLHLRTEKFLEKSDVTIFSMMVILFTLKLPQYKTMDDTPRKRA